MTALCLKTGHPRIGEQTPRPVGMPCFHCRHDHDLRPTFDAELLQDRRDLGLAEAAEYLPAEVRLTAPAA